MNSVTLIGRIGRDPETRYLPSGASVCSFSLATSERWNDKKTGERREDTAWHNIVMFGKSAELADRFLKKGKEVAITGRIKYEEYEAKDGSGKRHMTKIIADRFEFIGGGNGGNRGSQGGNEAPAGDNGMGDDEDVPF